MNRTFDLIVIGTGAAGTTVAYECRSAGWEVAIIDSRPFGGTCALRGCDPKKVLIGAAELIDWNHRMREKGVSSEGARIDWPALMRFKRTFTGPVPQSNEDGYADAGIAAFHGRARFTDRTTLQMGDDTLTGRYVVIAAGARPATLGIPGEEWLTDSEQFLELEVLPQRIVFVGGGYISFEFAHLAARAGADVQILHRWARPLPGFDPDLVDRLVQATRELGVDVRLDTAASAIDKKGGHLVVSGTSGGGEYELETDMVVHGAGRVPEIDDMDLDTGSVTRDERGVVVNEYLQSVSNPAVYAAGDSASTAGMPLTPIAGRDGEVVARNLLAGNQRMPNYSGVPTVVFTVPPIASVGLQEEAAKADGLRYRVSYQDTTDWYSTRRVGGTSSASKVLVDEESDLILGAHLFGPHAEEVINLFAVAMRTGLSAGTMKEVLYTFPSSSGDIASML